MTSVHFPEGDWYADAPKYYDMIFSVGTPQESTFILNCMQAWGQAPGTRILEPACGTGRLMQALAERGAQVDGFDDSEPMLDIARARLGGMAKGSMLSRARLQSFSLPSQYAAAHCLVSTFKYLLTEDEAASHLQRVHDALLPGGIYILGLHLSDYSDKCRSRERWYAQDGQTHVTCNIQSWPADKRTRLERVRSRLLVRRRSQARKLETNWMFRTYNARQLRQLLARVPGFVHVATYDFCHDIERVRSLHDEQLDCVLVLRREA